MEVAGPLAVKAHNPVLPGPSLLLQVDALSAKIPPPFQGKSSQTGQLPGPPAPGLQSTVHGPQ